MKFLNQFYLFNGLSKYYEHLLKRCNSGLLEFSVERKKELERFIKIMSQNMESNEMDLMKAFNCDPSWPVCLFDFTYKNSCNSFQIMRCQKMLTEYVVEDYFAESNFKKNGIEFDRKVNNVNDQESDVIRE